MLLATWRAFWISTASLVSVCEAVPLWSLEVLWGQNGWLVPRVAILLLVVLNPGDNEPIVVSRVMGLVLDKAVSSVPSMATVPIR